MAKNFAPNWSTAQNLIARDKVANAAGQADAILWLSAYKGTNEFILSVREGVRVYGRMTERQEAAVRRFMSNAVQATSANTPAPTAEVAQVVESGTYTIVNPKTGGYRTIRLQDVEEGKFDHLPATAQIVSYLSGPDNETDFVGFGFVVGSVLKVWKRFADEGSIPDYKAATKFLIGGKVNVATAALAYAVKSGRCARCSRKLTVPASVHQGYGPECVKKVGASALTNIQNSVAPEFTTEAPKGKRTYAELFGEDD